MTLKNPSGIKLCTSQKQTASPQSLRRAYPLWSAWGVAIQKGTENPYKWESILFCCIKVSLQNEPFKKQILVSSHSFWGSGIWSQLSQVVWFRLSWESSVTVLAGAAIVWRLIWGWDVCSWWGPTSDPASRCWWLAEAVVPQPRAWPLGCLWVLKHSHQRPLQRPPQKRARQKLHVVIPAAPHWSGSPAPSSVREGGTGLVLVLSAAVIKYHKSSGFK